MVLNSPAYGHVRRQVSRAERLASDILITHRPRYRYASKLKMPIIRFVSTVWRWDINETPPYAYVHHFQCNKNMVWRVWPGGGGGGTPYVMGDTYVPRFWPLFSLWQDRARSFLGYFSHPPTAKLSFGVQKLPIFTKIDLFGPKFIFFLDLFGSNFQRPVAHPHQFSGRVTPRGLAQWCRDQVTFFYLILL